MIMRWGWLLTPLCSGCYQRRKAAGYSVARSRESPWPVNSWQYTLSLVLTIVAVPLAILVGVPMLWAAVGVRPPFDSPYFWPVWSIVLLAAFCLYPVATRLYSYVRYERRVKRA